MSPYSERHSGKSVKGAAGVVTCGRMAWNIRGRRTEHAGAKHGSGAYWGRKWIAKHASNTERRRNARRETAAELEVIEGADAGLASDDSGRAALGGPASDEGHPAPQRSARRNTRRWCAGKVGRPHEFVWQETLGQDLGLPPLRVWACARCGRKAYNLKATVRAAG